MQSATDSEQLLQILLAHVNRSQLSNKVFVIPTEIRATFQHDFEFIGIDHINCIGDSFSRSHFEVDDHIFNTSPYFVNCFQSISGHFSLSTDGKTWFCST